MIMFLLLLLIYSFDTSVWVEGPPNTTAPPYNHWGNSPVKVVSSEISEITSDNLKSNADVKEIPTDTTIAIIKRRVN